MLRICCEALVEEVLQAAVVHSGGERSCLEVGAPVTDDLDEADELPLISGQLGVLRRHGAAEGGDGPLALMEDYPEIGS